MDVWRRQYLTASFKSSPPAKADIFSVCIRVPEVILLPLLAQSGASGAFTEPRTPDGKEVLSQYVVIWGVRMSQSELAHVMQTNPIVIGMARLGERRGLRVHENHAQALHQILRPDSAFLPSGPKSQYVAGPFSLGGRQKRNQQGAAASRLECEGLTAQSTGTRTWVNVDHPICGSTPTTDFSHDAWRGRGVQAQTPRPHQALCCCHGRFCQHVDSVYRRCT